MRHTLPDAVALDHVPGLNVVRQENHLSTDRTARRLDLSHRPHPVRLARPEREPGSVRAAENLAAQDPGRDLDLLPSAVAPCLLHAILPGAYDPLSRRSIFPRSKPTTTSPSMTVTGVAWYPSFRSSSSAAGLVRMFLSVNATPL